MGNKRIFYLDALRVISILCVMGIHVVSSFWPVRPLGYTAWRALNAYNAVVRFSVPALFMISGALMLSPERDVSVRSLYQRSIPRIVYRLVAWSLLYAAARACFRFAAGAVQPPELFSYMLACLKEPLHLWFLYAIIGLYIVTPLLRPVARERRLLRYFLILSLLVASLVPTLSKLLPALGFLEELADRFYLSYVLGYTGCYMLGYFLYSAEISKTAEAALYALGMLGLLSTLAGTAFLSNRDGYLSLAISEGPSLNLILTAAGAFTFFQMRVSEWKTGERASAWIFRLSENSFGMYLMHMFFIELFNAVGFSTELFAPVLSVPCVTLAAFLLSAAFSILVGRIPFAKKYLL